MLLGIDFDPGRTQKSCQPRGVATQTQPISVRHFTLCACACLCVGNLRGATADLLQLKTQLAAAEKAEDKAAITELSRRIVEKAPNESSAWEKLSRALFEKEDYDRCVAALDAWEKVARPVPAVIEDIRGDVSFARKEPKEAERHWRAFLARKPPATDAALTLDALADLCADQSRWRENAELRARAVAAEPTAARRVFKACAHLRLRQWDAAYAEMNKANALDSSDEQVKEWLPQFERLKKFLPRIRALDAQIAKTPANAVLWLDRAQILTVAQRPLLALDDCEQAMKLAPASLRARIQTGEALQDVQRGDDAAKLQVSYDLLRDVEDKHVTERALRDLTARDLSVLQNPGKAEPLAARSKTLRDLRQFTLALVDARAALAIDENFAAAHFEMAHDLDGLGKEKEALVEITKATELDPNNSVMWFYRGLIEAHRANYTAAIESQTRSLAIHESAVALDERAKCEQRLGKRKPPNE